jgi:hypothetical protein
LDLSSLKSFDVKALKKYTSPKSFDDLNVFLEKLPQNTSNTILIVAGVIWGVAGVLGLFTTIKIQETSKLRVELAEKAALLPAVPALKDNPVDPADVKAFVDEIKQIYKGLEISANGATITMVAKSTAQFGEFREAIGHVQNGGVGWRVSLDKLCVGGECPGGHPLAASLKINKVSVG